MALRGDQNPGDIFKKQQTWWLIAGAVFLIIVFMAIGAAIAFEATYKNRFYPGVSIGEMTVAGKTFEEVQRQLANAEDELQANGFVFTYEGESISINPIVISSSPDLAKEIIALDIESTANKAFSVGRSGNPIANFFTQMQTALFGKKIPVSYSLDKDELQEHLKTTFAKHETEPINSQIIVTAEEVEVTDEQSGKVFSYESAVEEVERQISTLMFEPIPLELKITEAQIKRSDTAGAVKSVENIIEIPFIGLVYDDTTWDIDRETLISWLEFQMRDGEVIVGINKEEAIEFLEDIALEINVSAVDAKFELQGERVTEFQSSRDGKKLNIEESYAKLNQHIMLGNQEDVQLSVEVDPAKVATQDLNDLGITDLLGRGTSNFSGSPVNRRHNIRTGVNSLDGVLIEPGEEFSLLDALGEIDGENGYLQELVIKGNRTIPEYGGGLCQIGSTTFRAALWSGLPITARRNHSYRVAYYEPAGMDATIYDPAPDMKFLNDTGHHILFIAKMEGDNLIFEYWGTPDGRKVTIEPNPPSIYNITSPGPPRYVETEDLAPGEKRKVESAHPGADTYFKYTVEYPDGEIVEEEFYSHYVAWPEVWLVGKEPSTTTEEIIAE